MTKIEFTQDPSTIKLLVVDDIPLNVLLIEKMLQQFKFTIIKANNGNDALSMIESEKPDMLLLDLMMPGIDGYQVLEEVRKTKDKEEFPVIILSALNSNDDVQKGMRCGANDFITKPIIMERLHNSVIQQLNLLMERRKA